jgi:hypothetical protein
MVALREREVELKDKLKAYEDSAGSLREINIKYNEVHSKLETLTLTIDSLEFERERLMLDEKYLAHLERCGIRYEELDRTLNDCLAEMERADRMLDIASRIHTAQTALGMISTTLSEALVQREKIESISRDIGALTNKEIGLKSLVMALSPKEGIVAEHVMVFITSLTEIMNAEIAPIWTYGLEVYPCDMENGKLTYQFPMRAISDDEEDIAEDISEGSDSQRDVINHAFRMAAYHFLHLTDYPLYTDEFGRSFDDIHRHNSVPAIATLADSERFSQAFVISNFNDSRNGFVRAERFVINDSNVELAGEYNAHVTFLY